MIKNILLIIYIISILSVFIFVGEVILDIFGGIIDELGLFLGIFFIIGIIIMFCNKK